MPIKHSKTSAKSDGADATLVQPSDWNANHSVDNITGIQDAQTPLTLAKFFFNFVGSGNTFAQANIQNKSNGAEASTDFVATMDTGTDSTGFVNLGINGSGYASATWAINGAGDGYLYVVGGNLAIGTTTANKDLVFFIGGTMAANECARFTTGGLRLPSQATDPSTPPAGFGMLYFKSIAGQVVPKRLGPAGVDSVLQDALAFNSIAHVTPASGTTAASATNAMGTAFTNAGTVANPVPASTRLSTSVRRTTFSSGTTAGTVAYHRQNVLMCWRGNAAGLGGFRLVMRFGLDTLQAGNRFFFGLNSSVSNPTNVDPLTSTTNAKVGVGCNANSGNLHLIHGAGGATPTTVDLGSDFPVSNTNMYELVLFAAPNGSSIGYRMTNLSTGATTSGTINSNMPASTDFLAPMLWGTNNATGAAAIFALYKWTLEMDY